jgi:hypothetical protein
VALLTAHLGEGDVKLVSITSKEDKFLPLNALSRNNVGEIGWKQSYIGYSTCTLLT